MTADDVKKVFQYQEGALIRRTTGKRAGYKNNKGYRMAKIGQKAYAEHRLVFLLHHGYLPEQVDHINRIRDDNRVENLRASDNSLNQKNTGVSPMNTSGYRGISWIVRDKVWRVSLAVEGIQKSFGHFKNKTDAVIALKSAIARYRPELMWEDVWKS